MTIFKKISLYFAMLAMFQLTNCTNKHMDDDAKYQQKPNKYFNYEVIKDVKEAPEGAQHHRTEVISDEYFATLFGADLDRRRITEKVEHGEITRIIEIWTSKRYNLYKVSAGLGAVGLVAGAAYSQRDYLNQKYTDFRGYLTNNRNGAPAVNPEQDEALQARVAAMVEEKRQVDADYLGLMNNVRCYTALTTRLYDIDNKEDVVAFKSLFMELYPDISLKLQKLDLNVFKDLLKTLINDQQWGLINPRQLNQFLYQFNEGIDNLRAGNISS